jgi:TrmH family RNA methyltransferase
MRDQPRQIEAISSPHNHLVKLVRSLVQRKHRDATGLFAVEGPTYISRAVSHGFRMRHLLLDTGHRHDRELADVLGDARTAGAQVCLVTSALLSRITGKDNPQKLMAVAEQRWANAPPADLQESDVVLALDRVRDPRNLGAIIRTAEATGVRQLLLIGSCCDPWSPEAVRSSAGSLFAVPMMKATVDAFVETARSWPGDVIGADAAASTDFRTPRRGPLLLVMGNESDGISTRVIEVCTGLRRIPMMPGASSLNLAVAAALMLYGLRLPFISADRRQS